MSKWTLGREYQSSYEIVLYGIFGQGPRWYWSTARPSRPTYGVRSSPPCQRAQSEQHLRAYILDVTNGGREASERLLRGRKSRRQR